MQLSLVATGGTIRGKLIPVSGSEFSIGRDPQCDLFLPSPIVSRRHALLLERDGKVLLRDLGSRNGTYVNGCLVPRECEIRSDDRLQIGMSEYRVLLVRGHPLVAHEQTTDRTEWIRMAEAPAGPSSPSHASPAPTELTW